MALKVELKAGESVIIGQCVIRNAGNRAHLVVEGKVSILRSNDIFTVENANTPAKRLYLSIQLMYLSSEISQEQQNNYLQFMREFLEAAPSSRELIGRINNAILAGSLYKALKEAKRLIKYEEDLLSNAKLRSPDVSKNVPANR